MSSPPPDASDDVCPVCKTIRYLNKDLEFLISPECYHPMCTTCVNRLFNDGPNQCPYAGCRRTLRRRGFRSAFFGNLAVEREVDVRRRVAGMFRQGEGDFVSLRAYNDWLDRLEQLTQDLVRGSAQERAAAEAEMAAWQHAEVTDDDAVQAKDETSASGHDGGGAGNGTDAANAGDSWQPESLLSLRKYLRRTKGGADDAPNGSSGAVLSPFGGVHFTTQRYKLRPDYDNAWADRARSDSAHRVGGYSVDDYYARTLFDAFAGLAVFVEDKAEEDPLRTEAGAAERKLSVVVKTAA